MNVRDYPVSTPYGWVKGYPLNLDPVNHPGYGFHNGIDYQCPMDTPVIVNGVTIGLSNNTGYSSGPHCHVGEYVNGVVQDPGVGNGFTFTSAVVYDTGHNDTDGNFVRITGDGGLWNYLHLHSILVNKGQVLKGGNMPYVEQNVLDDYEAHKLTSQALSYDPAYAAMGGTPGSPLVVVKDGKVVAGSTAGIGVVMADFRKNKEENLANPGTYTPVTEQLYKKKEA